MTQQGALW